MRSKTTTTRLVLLLLVLHLSTAAAVCLDPSTFVSGYKIPLESEAHTADAIVLGRVVSKQGLHEDPADPDGVTAYNVSIRVLARLKGNLPDVIVVRNENTSARYPMSAGEEHLLFVSRNGKKLSVDSCGSSTVMPEGEALLKEIQADLQKLK